MIILHLPMILIMLDANYVTPAHVKYISNKRKLLISAVFSPGETNALIIFIVEDNALISTETFTLRIDFVPSRMPGSAVLCTINKT